MKRGHNLLTDGEAQREAGGPGGGGGGSKRAGKGASRGGGAQETLAGPFLSSLRNTFVTQVWSSFWSFIMVYAYILYCVLD